MKFSRISKFESNSYETKKTIIKEPRCNVKNDLHTKTLFTYE